MMNTDHHTYQSGECIICGAVSKVEPLYLNEMVYSRKFGKVYYHGISQSGSSFNNDWRDYSTPGFIASTVDARGNSHSCGIHLDGSTTDAFFLEYNLGKKYTAFSGCVAPSSSCIGSSSAIGYQKYVRIYCDSVLVYQSDMININSNPQDFLVDVTNVDYLKIEYSQTTGSNDLAVFYDACVS